VKSNLRFLTDFLSRVHRKNMLPIFPFPAGMVSDIPAGDRKIANLFYSVLTAKTTEGCGLLKCNLFSVAAHSFYFQLDNWCNIHVLYSYSIEQIYYSIFSWNHFASRNVVLYFEKMLHFLQKVRTSNKILFFVLLLTT
jgi:hypothetical protein